jgi:DNA polymerase
MPARSPKAALDEIACQVRCCLLCRLWESRTHAVPGDGSPRARIVLVGEAPGRSEDASGRPFQGQAGRELDRLLTLAGLSRARVFITSVNRCHPPGNRRPRRDEMAVCVAEYLERQLHALGPRVIVLMGAVAAEALLRERARGKRLASLVGRVIERQGRRYLVTYHPAAAMRLPAIRRAAERHFRRLRAMLSAAAFRPTR